MTRPYAYPGQPAHPYARTAQPARQPVTRAQSPAPAVRPIPKLPIRDAAPAVAVAPTEPRPEPASLEPIVMPSPEHFGIALATATPTSTATAAPVMAAEEEDWLPLLKRLDDMGMSRFEFRGQSGSFRMSCEVQGRPIEASGATKAEVLRRALAEVTVR